MGYSRQVQPLSKASSEVEESVDDLRRDVETDFSEHKDHRGTVRRRSMIRNVSRDDYLLARGANLGLALSHQALTVLTAALMKLESCEQEVSHHQRNGVNEEMNGSAWFGQPTPAPTPPMGKRARCLAGTANTPKDHLRRAQSGVKKRS